MSEHKKSEDIRTYIRQHYGAIADGQGESMVKDRDEQTTASSSCCGSTVQPGRDTFETGGMASSCCGSVPSDQVGNIQFYDAIDTTDLPNEVTSLSLGCGDPITLASLQLGQTVLDLGAGGGIDCFLAAKRVGPNGHVIGVDMTPSMLDRARTNKEKLGVDNVDFRLGEIEHLPVADNSVDVIVSNCVINLSPDKPQVFREAYRALKPGGKLAVSDIVTDGPLPEHIKANLSSWAGCIAGALEAQEYIEGLLAAGFEDVCLSPVYFDRETIANLTTEQALALDLSNLPVETLQRGIFSARITARKPN